MPLLLKCSSPFAASRHPHLRAPPHVCCHVRRTHARPCLSMRHILLWPMCRSHIIYCQYGVLGASQLVRYSPVG